MAGASDNGGWSDSGSPDDLPDLPEEWGVIVIPDDLSELSDEVAAIRAELRLSERPTRWRRLINRPGIRRVRRLATSLLRAPVLIVSMAVLVTVASLVASAWPGPPRQPAVQRTSGSDDLESLPALELVGEAGQTVQLKANLPAVVLVTDGCDCDRLVKATVAAAQNRTQIAIVVIAAALSPAATGKAATTQATQAAPQAQTAGQSVLLLHAPPSNNVREQLKLGPPDGTAAALLVNRNGQVIHRIARTVSVDDIQPYLALI